MPATIERLSKSAGIVAGEILPADLIESLSPLEIINRGIECERDEIIPLDAVIIENAIIDPSHATQLGDSMKQRREQITPIAVRTRLDENNEIVYDIIDGFHRTAGKKANGDSDIKATVIYGCSDEELYDLRVLSASSVRSVQFARLVEWMTKSWETTPWSKMGLGVAQAFAMTMNDTQSPYTVNLESEEVAAIKTWAREKALRWGRPVSSTYDMLRTAANADPELVRQVRTQHGGLKDRIGQITPARLQAVVKSFPSSENYPAQRALLRVSREYRLSAEQLEGLVESVRPLVQSRMSEEKIFQLAQRALIVEKTIYQAPVRKAKQEVEDDDLERENSPLVFDEDWDEIEPTDKELDEIEGAARDSRDHVSRRTERRIITKYAAGDITEAAAFGRGDGSSLEQLRKRVKDLEQALELANKRNGNHPELWWQTAVYLTPQERTLMQAVMYENRDLLMVAASLKLTQNQALGYIKSAFAKRQLAEPEKENVVAKPE